MWGDILPLCIAARLRSHVGRYLTLRSRALAYARMWGDIFCVSRAAYARMWGDFLPLCIGLAYARMWGDILPTHAMAPMLPDAIALVHTPYHIPHSAPSASHKVQRKSDVPPTIRCTAAA